MGAGIMSHSKKTMILRFYSLWVGKIDNLWLANIILYMLYKCYGTEFSYGEKRTIISSGESLRRIQEGDEIWAGFKTPVDIWWSGLRKYSKQTEQLIQKKMKV